MTLLTFSVYSRYHHHVVGYNTLRIVYDHTHILFCIESYHSGNKWSANNLNIRIFRFPRFISLQFSVNIPPN